MSTLPSLQALRKVPEVNASWNTEYIRQYHSIDISVAVQTPGGLMVPIVHNADALGLSDISAKVKDLATKVSRQSTPFLAAHICMYKQHGYAGQAADGLLMCRVLHSSGFTQAGRHLCRGGASCPRRQRLAS